MNDYTKKKIQLTELFKKLKRDYPHMTSVDMAILVLEKLGIKDLPEEEVYRGTV